MKAAKYVLIVLGGLVILLILGIQAFFRLPLPDYEGTVELSGLASDVEVRFDAYGVPHVFAENEQDLFFAQGYITARERMFQMDVTRLAGRGELSTLFGERTVGTDKLMKTIGFYRLARAEFRQLSPECRDAIVAYTGGVNAYLRTAKHLPREYLLLRARPGPWEPEDTVVCGTLMAYSLTRSKQTDLVLYRIGEAAGEDILTYFIPSFPEFAPTVSGPDARKGATSHQQATDRPEMLSSSSWLPTYSPYSPGFLCAQSWSFPHGHRLSLPWRRESVGTTSPYMSATHLGRQTIPVATSSSPSSARGYGTSALSSGAGMDAYPEPPEIAASNWMIFAGSLTATGAPILTGSPDLQPTLPGLFYVVRLRSGTFDVIGGSIPGTPGVSAVGFNGKIAWSTVNGRVDELDYFIERVNPDNPDQYLTEHGYEGFQVVEETLKIKTKTGIREEGFRVRLSRHGPIVSEVMPLAPANAAMKWVGMSPTGLFEGFLELNRASTFEEFRDALRHVKTPTLNVGYADEKGNIGYQYVASPPVRRKGTGTLPVPGWTGEYEWDGNIPFEMLPCDLNPVKGYLGSFNNPAKLTDYHMTNYYLFERALRFEELAKDFGKISLQGARGLQLDTVSVVAKRWVPRALLACRGRDDLAKGLQLFDGWDGSIDRQSPAATLFNAFYFRLMENAFADEVSVPLWADHLSQSYTIYVADLLLARIIDQNDHILFDNVTTPQKETRDDMLVKSMEETVAELTQRLGDDPRDWAWGRVHRMTFTHPLGAKLPFLNLRPIPTSGDTFTIQCGMWNNKDPYAMESGGVIRLVVDFSDYGNSTIICPPGQSGHYMSPHYDDLAEMWAEGKQIPMRFVSAGALPRVLTLKAKSQIP